MAEALRPYVATQSPDMIGHGGRPLPGRFSIRDFAADLVDWLDRNQFERTFVMGYSTGGYIALYLARHFPQRVRGVIALATKTTFDVATVAHFRHLVSRERLGQPGLPRAAVLKRIHAPNDYLEVARRNADLFLDLGNDPALTAEDFAAIEVPVMLVSSNRDPLVPWNEVRDLGKVIPRAHLAMFYGPAHPIESVPLHRVAKAMWDWMEK